MGRAIVKEIHARDSGTHELPIKEIDFKEGKFLIQTQKGKIIYLEMGKEDNAIAIPQDTMPLSQLVEIADGIDWKGVEISANKIQAGEDYFFNMQTINSLGEHNSYFFPNGTVKIGSPFIVSQDKRVAGRLIPQFWEAVQKIIEEDKIIVISYSTPEEWMTMIEADRRYETKIVNNKQCFVLDSSNPRKIDCGREVYPEYYLEISGDETGLIINRSQSSYMLQYLYYRTKQYKDGITVEEITRKI